LSGICCKKYVRATVKHFYNSDFLLRLGETISQVDMVFEKMPQWRLADNPHLRRLARDD